MSDDDKSWREIDRQRDSSRHTEDDRQGASRHDERSDSKYKQELEKLFSSGTDVPEQFQEVMEGLQPEEGTEEAERKKEIDKLRDADGFRQFAKAVNVYFETGYRLPDDENLLIRMLDHPDNDIVRLVLAHIIDLAGRRELQRTAPIKSRLSTIRTMTHDTRIRELIDELEEIVG